MESRNPSGFGPEVAACILGGLLLFAAFAHGAATGYWISDDHAQVYGLTGQKPPSLSQALNLGSHFSVHRMLMGPLIGYGGSVLGPVGTHFLAISLHGVCAFLLSRLATRLGCGTVSAICGATVFALSPWSCQPVLWWSSVPAVVSSILIVASVHLFLNAIQSDTRWRLVASSCVLVLLSLMTYDLWLPSWLIFPCMTWCKARQMAMKTPARWRALALVMLAPYVIFAALLVLGDQWSHAQKPSFSVVRWLAVFGSIHVRYVQSAVMLPWKNLLSLAWTQPVALIAGIAMSCSLCFLWAVSATTSSPSRRVPATPSSLFLGPCLFAAWVVFFSGRIVLALAGGVALHGRLGYGASLALGLAVAMVLENLARNRPSFGSVAAVGLFASTIVSVLFAACLGKAEGAALNARAELVTFQRIVDDLSKASVHPPFVLISGKPAPQTGELDYFSEGTAFWLNYQLHRSGYEGQAYLDAGSVVLDQAETGVPSVPAQNPYGSSWIYQWKTTSRISAPELVRIQ